MEKFYSEKQIYTSTFFGGPVTAGILIYQNFKRIGDKRKALLTLLVTLVFTFLLFSGLISLPEEISDNIPDILFTALYTIIVYLIYHTYFASIINPKIEGDDNKISNWRVAGWSIVGIVINIGIILGIAILEPEFPGEKVVIGEIKNEVYYDKEDFNEEQAKVVGSILNDFGYFDDTEKGSVRVEKANTGYQLLLPLAQETWYDTDLLSQVEVLKEMLSIDLEKEFKIVLIDYLLDGNTVRKEI